MATIKLKPYSVLDDTNPAASMSYEGLFSRPRREVRRSRRERPSQERRRVDFRAQPLFGQALREAGTRSGHGLI